MTVYAFWQLSCVHFLHRTISKRIKIQINIWRNTFYKERLHVYMCGFLTSSILIDEVNNYTGVILRIACFDLKCPLFTCLDFWHRLSSIPISLHLSVQKFMSFEPRTSCENLFMSYVNNKDADQPAHLCSLISIFVICCLDSLISQVSISKISRL